MQCRELERALEQNAAASLPADAAAHLDECGRCRGLVSDLEEIRGVARHLAAEEAEPSERIWLTLRAQLETEGLLHPPPKTPRADGWRAGWLAGWPRPVLAGAYLAFLVAAAALVGVRNYSRPVLPDAARLGTASLDTQLASVQRRTVAVIHQHNPDVTASLHKNLEIVENFIGLCERSVRQQPQNQLAREYLYGAYQQKAELLATMMDRRARGD